MRIPSRLEIQATLVHRRVRSLPSDQVLRWLDIAGTEMSRAAADYVRNADPAALAEYDRGLAVLLAMSRVFHHQRD